MHAPKRWAGAAQSAAYVRYKTRIHGRDAGASIAPGWGGQMVIDAVLLMAASARKRLHGAQRNRFLAVTDCMCLAGGNIGGEAGSARRMSKEQCVLVR